MTTEADIAEVLDIERQLNESILRPRSLRWNDPAPP